MFSLSGHIHVQVQAETGLLRAEHDPTGAPAGRDGRLRLHAAR